MPPTSRKLMRFSYDRRAERRELRYVVTGDLPDFDVETQVTITNLPARFRNVWKLPKGKISAELFTSDDGPGFKVMTGTRYWEYTFIPLRQMSKKAEILAD